MPGLAASRFSASDIPPAILWLATITFCCLCMVPCPASVPTWHTFTCLELCTVHPRLPQSLTHLAQSLHGNPHLPLVFPDAAQLRLPAIPCDTAASQCSGFCSSSLFWLTALLMLVLVQLFVFPFSTWLLLYNTAFTEAGAESCLLF